MKKISFALAMLCMAVAVYAVDGNYNVALIQPELRKEANAVKRSEEIVFELLSEGKARLYRKYAITVLNENGEKFASFVDYYHKFRSIRSIDGTLYDANGKKIRSLKKSEIEDHTGGGDDGLCLGAHERQGGCVHVVLGTGRDEPGDRRRHRVGGRRAARGAAVR